MQFIGNKIILFAFLDKQPMIDIFIYKNLLTCNLKKTHECHKYKCRNLGILGLCNLGSLIFHQFFLSLSLILLLLTEK